MESINEEYGEVIGKCEVFLKDIELEIGSQNFIFAEVEENEVELEKVKHWLKKVGKRDYIKPLLHKTALQKVKQCEKSFQDFAHRVYEAQGSKERRFQAPAAPRPSNFPPTGRSPCSALISNFLSRSPF